MLKKGNEIPTIDVNLVTISLEGSENELGLDTANKIAVEPAIETTDAVKGNTTNNAMKDATIETGYVVKVPMFIGVGEKILITTKDGKYSSRA